MRKVRTVVLLAIVLFIGCSKDEIAQEVVILNEGTISFSCYLTDHLSTGEVVKTSFKIDFVNIWNAENRDFDPEKSGQYDMIGGYLFDKKANKSISPSLEIRNTRYFSEILPAGRYFIYVDVGSRDLYSYEPSFAYSYKYIEIKKGEVIFVEKIFDEYSKRLSFQEW